MKLQTRSVGQWVGAVLGFALLGIVVSWLCVIGYNVLPFEKEVVLDATGDWPAWRLMPKACHEWFAADPERWERECELGSKWDGSIVYDLKGLTKIQARASRMGYNCSSYKELSKYHGESRYADVKIGAPTYDGECRTSMMFDASKLDDSGYLGQLHCLAPGGADLSRVECRDGITIKHEPKGEVEQYPKIDDGGRVCVEGGQAASCKPPPPNSLETRP